MPRRMRSNRRAHVFPPRELRGDRGPFVAAVAPVVPLLEELRWVGCFINSTGDLDPDQGLGTGEDNILISL